MPVDGTDDDDGATEDGIDDDGLTVDGGQPMTTNGCLPPCTWKIAGYSLVGSEEGSSVSAAACSVVMDQECW